MTRQLAMSGARVIGLDFSVKMIEKAGRNVPEASFINGDIATIRFNAKLAGVFAWDSLFHVPMEWQEAIVRKIIGLLGPDGVFLFTAGGDNRELVSDMFGRPFYYASLSANQYEKIMNEENCRVVFHDVDDPSGDGHRVICCRKN